MAHYEGYEKVQRLLRHGATLAYDLDDQSLGHGLIDLTRRARLEIEKIGLKSGHTSVPIDSYEGMLLYRVMPEISRRLIQRGGARLLMLPGEKPDSDVTNIPGDSLRRLTGECHAKSAFDLIAEKVRDRFDPGFSNTSTFFACEAIQRDCRAGNIVEIALSRVLAPEINSGRKDIFAELIGDWHAKQSVAAEYANWTPHTPEYDIEMSDFSDGCTGGAPSLMPDPSFQ